MLSLQVGRPYALDPHTLETLGESDMGGQVAQRLAGHYRTVPGPDGSQRCVVFGTQVGTAHDSVDQDQEVCYLPRTA
jgi:carotenoid cleavage dioxygenase-like enzyme